MVSAISPRAATRAMIEGVFFTKARNSSVRAQSCRRPYGIRAPSSGKSAPAIQISQTLFTLRADFST